MYLYTVFKLHAALKEFSLVCSLKDRSLRICSKILARVLGSIVVSIPACHAGDRGSIPRRGDFFFTRGLSISS